MAGIGFFAPLPLAMMLPFMAGQSMIMGDAFGKAYQYGKRKISSMSNEDFNKMDANTLGRELQEDYSAIIPHLKVAVHESRDFQSLVIQELAEIIKSLPKEILSALGTGSDQGNTDIASSILDIFKIFNSGGQIIPQAFADQPIADAPPQGGDRRKYTAVENYARRWMDETTGKANIQRMTHKETLYILKQISRGNLNDWKIFRTTLVKHLDSFEAPKAKDPIQAIEDVGGSGWSKELAIHYSNWNIYLTFIGNSRNSRVAIARQLRFFMDQTRAWNRKVQSDRSIPNHYVVDQAESLKQRQVVFKS